MSQAAVFVFNGVAQAIAGGVEISKQAFDIALGGVATGRGFDSGKNGRQVGVQAFIAMGGFHHIGKQLAGVNKVAFGFYRIVFNVGGNDTVGQFGVVHALVTAFDIGAEVFTDETVKQRAQHVLLKIPAVDRPTHIVGNGPYLAL